MRWLVVFAVTIAGCVASIPDDPTLSADLAWGTAGVLTSAPRLSPPRPAGPAACSECDGSGVVPIKADAPTVCPNAEVPADSALLVLEVPAAAVVEINGLPTQATGTVRRYMANGLAAGKRYEFVVRADGQTRVVTLGPGEQASLSFVDGIQTCPQCRGCGGQLNSVMVTR